MTATVKAADVAAPIHALALHNVRHSFDGNNVVKGVNLEVKPGEVVCLSPPARQH